MKILITILLVTISVAAYSNIESQFDILIVKHKHSKKIINKSNSKSDTLDIPDISSSPAVQQMLTEKAALGKDKLYKSHYTDLVYSFSSNHSAVEVKEAMDAGLIFYGGEPRSEIDRRIDEYQRIKLYKQIAFVASGILIVLAMWIGFKKYNQWRSQSNKSR